MKGETTQDVIFLLHFLVCFGVFAFDFIGCCGTVAVHFIRLTCGKGYWTSAKLCCRFTPLIQVVLHSCKKICSKRTGGLSDWIPADSILHQISRNREGWMMKGNKKKKSNENQRYLRHILCFTSPVVSEEPLLLCGFSEMGINLWCPWWKSCARAFSFGTMLKAGSCVTWAAGKSTERWDAAVEEVLRSPFLEELFSPEEEKVNVPLCVLPWAHPQKLDVQRIIRKLGHFP